MAFILLAYFCAFIFGTYLLIHAMSNFVDNNKVISDLPHDIKTELKGIFHG